MAQAALPPLRPDLTLHPGPADEHGWPTWTIEDPVRGRWYRINRVDREILTRGHRMTAEDVRVAIARETPLTPPDAAEIDAMREFLLRAGLARVARGSFAQAKHEAAWWTWLTKWIVVRIPLFNPDRALGAALPYVEWIYTRTFLAVMAALTAMALYLVGREWDLFVASARASLDANGFAAYAVAIALAKSAHECAHAFTAKRYGVPVPSMGVVLIVGFPILYTDTGATWKLPAYRQRAAIAAAGVATELALAVLATLAWVFLPEHSPYRDAAFFLAAVGWVLSLAINGAPFMRWDGYYVLSDLLRMENLHERSFAVGRWQLRRWLFGWDDPVPEPLTPAARVSLAAFAYATWAYRALVFVGIALLVYHLTFKLAGLALLTIELGTFVFGPVWREARVWYARRAELPPRRRLILVAILAALAGILALPFEWSISAPAVYRGTRLDVYTGVPGRVAAVNARVGQDVRAGETLVVLTSPDLDHEQGQAAARLSTVQTQLKREMDPEQRVPLLRQLERELAAYAAAKRSRERLTLAAPEAGTVDYAAEGLAEDLWVSSRQPLFRLVRGDATGVAYVDETDLPRIRAGNAATFYAHDGRRLAARIERVDDAAAVGSIEERELLSSFGGRIRTSPDGKTLQESRYRVHFALEPEARRPERTVAGELQIAGERMSLVAKAWRAVAAVWIRESGF